MKKITLIMAAVLVALAGCKQQTSEEILASFEEDLNTYVSDYREALKKVNADATLSAAQKAKKAEDLEEKLYEKVVDAGTRIIENDPSNVEVVPSVLGNIYAYMEEDDLAELLASLDEAVKADKLVSSLTESMAAKKATAVGRKFKNFTVDHVSGVDKDGNPIYVKKSLSDFVGKGKVVLVDFWSPWCPPCKAEIPNIKNVWEKYHGDDFDVLSVAVWEESRKMDWRNTIDTAAFYGVKWQQLNNGHREPASLYGIDGIPHMILFGKDGIILKRGDDLRGEKLEKAVAEVLGR